MKYHLLRIDITLLLMETQNIMILITLELPLQPYMDQEMALLFLGIIMSKIDKSMKLQQFNLMDLVILKPICKKEPP